MDDHLPQAATTSEKFDDRDDDHDDDEGAQKSDNNDDHDHDGDEFLWRHHTKNQERGTKPKDCDEDDDHGSLMMMDGTLRH